MSDNESENSEINLQLDETTDDESIELSDYEINNKNKKRKTQIWIFERIFNNEIEAKKAIESKWSYVKTHKTNQGPKDYYKCKLNPKCPAKMHLHYINKNENVNMLRNAKDHQHEIQVETRGIRREIKHEINKMFEINVTAPLSII